MQATSHALHPMQIVVSVKKPTVAEGCHPFSRVPAEITLSKSNGLAVEDVIAAGFVYERLTAEKE